MVHAKPLILVVDDEALLRFSATDVLEEGGFSVVEATNAASALQVLEEQRGVEVLFTDIQMPGAFNGMELAWQVHLRWPHILLLITSGKARPSAAEIPDDGRFLAKPYRPSDLIWQLNELLKRPTGIGNL